MGGPARLLRVDIFSSRAVRRAPESAPATAPLLWGHAGGRCGPSTHALRHMGPRTTAHPAPPHTRPAASPAGLASCGSSRPPTGGHRLRSTRRSSGWRYPLRRLPRIQLTHRPNPLPGAGPYATYHVCASPLCPSATEGPVPGFAPRRAPFPPPLTRARASVRQRTSELMERDISRVRFMRCRPPTHSPGPLLEGAPPPAPRLPSR